MPKIDTGDTAWMLASAALVMFMTPGLAFFYSGLVRSKNVLSTIMHSFMALAIITVVWTLIGHTLAFGPDKNLLIGGLDFVGLKGVGADPHPLAPTIPHTLFALYQMMFAVITPALISGTFAERMKFSGFMAFMIAWSVLVYAPVAHWVFGGGFLGLGEGKIGALDFAGGTVVHINAGAAALACALVLGPRKGWPDDRVPPHNVPFVVLGAAILWFGWFGFNAGSAVSSGALAASAFAATHIAAAAAVFGWIIPEWIQHKKVTTVGAATGAVAGLVAITPASGYVRPWAALIIGFVASFICYFAVNLKWRFNYDDALDVVGVHLVGGMVGALLTGIFATKLVNAAGADGLWYGDAMQVVRQMIAVGVTLLWSFVVSYIILLVVNATIGLRVSESDEYSGLDVSQHGESGYALTDS